jgi:hypothetical protein
MSIDQKIKSCVDYLFLPTSIDYRGRLTTPLLYMAIIIIIVFAVISLPLIQKIVWMQYFPSNEKAIIFENKDVTKSWFDSISYILDLTVALLIGGSIFGEKLANSFRGSIIEYEKARKVFHGDKTIELTTDIGLAVKCSIEKVNELRSGTILSRLKNIFGITQELRKIYRLAFSKVPRFYYSYIRFVLYSSFPGGLFGLLAFVTFFISSALKLVGMYLGSPYLEM